jgi:hypothetical protein
VGSTAHAHYPMKRYRWSVPCKCAWVGAQRAHGQGLGGGYTQDAHTEVSLPTAQCVFVPVCYSFAKPANEVRCLFCILEKKKKEDFYSQKAVFLFDFLRF